MECRWLQVVNGIRLDDFRGCWMAFQILCGERCHRACNQQCSHVGGHMRFHGGYGGNDLIPTASWFISKS